MGSPNINVPMRMAVSGYACFLAITQNQDAKLPIFGRISNL